MTNLFLGLRIDVARSSPSAAGGGALVSAMLKGDGVGGGAEWWGSWLYGMAC
jgi:hypothetical protein